MNHVKPALLLVIASIFFNPGCKTQLTKSSKDAYGGAFPEKPTVVQKAEVAKNETPTSPEVQIAPETVVPLKETQAISQKHKSSFKKALGFKKTLRYQPLVDSTDTDQILEPIKPMEKNALIGFWLVIGSLLAGWIPIIGLFSGFAMIAGFILGIIGLINIKKAPDTYRGKGKAIAAILIPSILVFIFILAIVALIASGFFLI
ncbi:MAG: hypothetical protein IT244_10385 [Bacteroidia bacterium]|nr:hypothetical protein [Bacteroidia bacterium]